MDATSAALGDLKKRLEQLRCVSAGTKQLVLKFAHEQSDPARLGSYLAEILSFVEQEIASINHRQFQAFCAHNYGLSDLRQFGTLIEQPNTPERLSWLNWAALSQSEAPVSLYCLAN